MSPSARYGLFGGLACFAFARLAPQPGGSIAFWSAIALQSACGSWIIWRRLRLPWATLAAAAGLAVSGAMIGVSARGLDLVTMIPVLPTAFVGSIWLGFLLVPICLGLESLRNSREWQAWSASMGRTRVRDMLLFRHVPDLHGS